MPIQPSGYQIYQQNAIQTALPEKLVLMLYDGALRFLLKAQKALQEGDLQSANEGLIRTQAIINELMVNVDKEAGEIAENLVLLYDYMYRKLVEANVKKDLDAAREVEDMLRNLRDAWQQATIKSQQYASKTSQENLAR